MKLEFIETLGGKVFRIDDVSDEAPMIELRFFNEFDELPYAIRSKAARAALEFAVKTLLREDTQP
jgi:hypothetical protein